MCTANAKGAHTESSTYGPKFGLMCKSLQQDVTINGISEPKRAAITGRFGTYVTEKQGNPDREMTAELCNGLGLVADKLQSLSLKL